MMYWVFSEQISLAVFKGALHPLPWSKKLTLLKCWNTGDKALILSIKEKFKAMAQLIATQSAC